MGDGLATVHITYTDCYLTDHTAQRQKREGRKLSKVDRMQAEEKESDSLESLALLERNV